MSAGHEVAEISLVCFKIIEFASSDRALDLVTKIGEESSREPQPGPYFRLGGRPRNCPEYWYSLQEFW